MTLATPARSGTANAATVGSLQHTSSVAIHVFRIKACCSSPPPHLTLTTPLFRHPLRFGTRYWCPPSSLAHQPDCLQLIGHSAHVPLCDSLYTQSSISPACFEIDHHNFITIPYVSISCACSTLLRSAVSYSAYRSYVTVNSLTCHIGC